MAAGEREPPREVHHAAAAQNWATVFEVRFLEWAEGGGGGGAAGGEGRERRPTEKERGKKSYCFREERAVATGIVFKLSLSLASSFRSFSVQGARAL